MKIEGTAEEVRENTSSLRVQLDEAQRNLKIRKEYDVLADKITRTGNLKERDEQHVNIEKLKAEIEELERESQELSQTWSDRRQQMGKVGEEAARLRRQIRNEKEPEEVEEEKRAQEMLDVERERDAGSHVGTPRPEDAMTPGHDSRGMTPFPEGDVGTPQPEGKGSASATPGPDVEMEDNQDGTVNVQVTVTEEKTADDMDTT